MKSLNKLLHRKSIVLMKWPGIRREFQRTQLFRSEFFRVKYFRARFCHEIFYQSTYISCALTSALEPRPPQN